MCYAFYIGVNSPLNEISWKSHDPDFGVSKEDESHEILSQHFTTTNIGYLASWQGCGCGFVWNYENVYDIPPENMEINFSNPESLNEREEYFLFYRSRQALARYIEELDTDGPIELYVCWEGEQDLCEAQETISIGDIRNHKFEFAEKTLFRVTR